MTNSSLRYDYLFDPEDDSTASRVCRMVGKHRKVLELGCAAGAMSAVMSRHYQCRVTGLEYDTEAAERAKSYCEDVLVTSIETPDWAAMLQGKQFDTVVAADVLEHLHEPDACLRQLHSLLTADGRLIVSIPNIAHGGVIASLLCNEFEYAETGLLDRTHVHFFTRNSLGKMLHDCGFRVAHVETVDTGPWHPEFHEKWAKLPTNVRDWLAQAPSGRAYQILMLAYRDPAPGPWQDVDTGQEDWLRTFPSAFNSTEINEMARLQQQSLALQRQIEQVLNSCSWRLTAPVRKIINWFR